MISAATYDYLTEVLSSRILGEKTIEETLKYAKGNGKPSKGVTAHLSDAIERWVYRERDKYILISEDGELYAYTGKWWEKVTQGNFMRELIKRILTRMEVSVTYRTYSADTIAKECMSGLTSSDSCLFVPDRRYIAFENGIFDLKDNRLREFNPRFKTEIRLDFPYISDKEGYLASNPGHEEYKLWDRKLDEIFDNKEFRDAFQMFCGTLLIDRSKIKIEHICYLEGPGANGKSVVVHAVANVFGDRYFSKYTPDQLIRGRHADYYIADMKGKLCNLCDDLDAKIISGGDFKRMVSGESIQGRECGGKHPQKVVSPMFLCCTNSMPETDDDSYGFHRRQLRLLTTRQRFGEDRKKDPQLTFKLRQTPCRQRIFNWIYQGYRKVMSRDGEITLSPEVRRAMEVMKEESTPMRRWFRDSEFRERRDNEPGEWMLLSQLFEDFQKWCVRNGVLHGRDSRVMGLFLRGMNFESKATARGVKFLIARKTYDDYEKDI